MGRDAGFNLDAGQFVALGTDQQIERDGSYGGLRVKVIGGSRQTVTAMGINASGASVNKVFKIPAQTTIGTVFTVYSNTDNVVYATIQLGAPCQTHGLTEVSLQREHDDYVWDGFVTSDTNQ